MYTCIITIIHGINTHNSVYKEERETKGAGGESVKTDRQTDRQSHRQSAVKRDREETKTKGKRQKQKSSSINEMQSIYKRNISAKA